MTKEPAEPGELLSLLGDEGVVALTSLRAYLQLEPRACDSAFSTARTVLDVYEDPGVLETCVDWSIRSEQLLDGGQQTLFVVGGTTEQNRFAPLFLATLDEVLRQAFVAASRRRASSGSALVEADGSPAPAAAAVARRGGQHRSMPQLASLASTGGSEGSDASAVARRRHARLPDGLRRHR